MAMNRTPCWRTFDSPSPNIFSPVESTATCLAPPSSTGRAQKRLFLRSCPRSHAGFKAIFQKVV